MGFEFTQTAREFFEKIGVSRRPGGKSITGQFESLLECYWLCCTVGLRFSKYKPAEASEKSEEFVRSLSPLSGQSELIQALGFYHHCKQEGLLDSSHETMLRVMNRFFSDSGAHELGAEAYEMFNAYANGGFAHLHPLVSDVTDLSDLLVEVADLLIEAD